MLNKFGNVVILNTHPLAITDILDAKKEPRNQAESGTIDDVFAVSVGFALRHRCHVKMLSKVPGSPLFLSHIFASRNWADGGTGGTRYQLSSNHVNTPSVCKNLR